MSGSFILEDIAIEIWSAKNVGQLKLHSLLAA